MPLTGRTSCELVSGRAPDRTIGALISGISAILIVWLILLFGRGRTKIE